MSMRVCTTYALANGAKLAYSVGFPRYTFANTS